jgi:hypothetical protein
MCHVAKYIAIDRWKRAQALGLPERPFPRESGKVVDLFPEAGGTILARPQARAVPRPIGLRRPALIALCLAIAGVIATLT